MVGINSLLSLAVPLLAVRSVGALDLDVAKDDSIKSVAKTLAGGIVATYTQFQESDEFPGAGLFPDPYYWWEAGAVFNALIEYSHLTGDSQYDDLVTKALVHQIGDFNALMPANQTKTLGNDDQSTWGLAAMTAAEVGRKDPEEFKWVDAAKNVFDTQTMRWDDETCDGGLRWQIFTFNNGYNYKNSMSNGQFFLLAARLAEFTGNKTFAEWAEKSYDWSVDSGLVKKDPWSVYDGMDVSTNCSQPNRIQWSSTHAMYLEGAAFMFNFTNGEQKWKDVVTGLANRTSIFRDEDSGVLYEVACERSDKCDVDQKAFKGIAARSFARTAVVAPFAADFLNKALDASAKAAADACEGDGENLKCAFKWVDGEDEDSDVSSVSDGGLGEAFNALEVVQSLLYSGENLVSKEAQKSASANGTSTTKPSGGPSGTASGTAAPASGTGAAGKTAVAWTGVALAGVVAVMGL